MEDYDFDESIEYRVKILTNRGITVFNDIKQYGMSNEDLLNALIQYYDIKFDGLTYFGNLPIFDNLPYRIILSNLDKSQTINLHDIELIGKTYYNGEPIIISNRCKLDIVNAAFGMDMIYFMPEINLFINFLIKFPFADVDIYTYYDKNTCKSYMLSDIDVIWDPEFYDDYFEKIKVTLEKIYHCYVSLKDTNSSEHDIHIAEYKKYMGLIKRLFISIDCNLIK